MEARSKKRILLGAIIMLLLINLSAILTIGYNRYERKKALDKEYIQERGEKKNPHNRMKLFVKKELELSDEQFERYCMMKDENMQRTDKYIAKIKSFKKEIIAEINKDKPDSIVLLLFSDSIGQQHKFISMEMNRHFLAIKQMLEPEQQVKLNKLLNRMDERYRPNRKRRFGKSAAEKGYRHRHGNRKNSK